MKIITSLHNEEIKSVARLAEVRHRTTQKQCIVEGKRAITTCLQVGWEMQQLYVTAQTIDYATSIVASEIITQVSADVMDKISPSSTPSQLLAVFPLPPQPDVTLLSEGIVLDHIADPGNMGTLLRTCAAMGKKTVIVIEGADPYQPKVIQASAGTIALLNVFRLSWDKLLACTKVPIEHAPKGLALCALVVQGGVAPTMIPQKNSLLVIGSEAHGISKEHLATCDYAVTLAMPSTVESLNAAVAGSIAMYLAWAQ